MMSEQEKKAFSLYLEPEMKNEIENFFLENKIKNFNEGYRNLISIGYQHEKKRLNKGGKK
jgi:hypothetical protein